MMDSSEVKCSDCGAVLEAGVEGARVNPPDPCPHCGSTLRTVHLAIHDQVPIKVRDRIEMKVKDNSFPSKKKKVRKELIQGFDVRVSKGDYVNKEREIDRDNNTYREHVTEEETGEVIHSVKESLTDHFGHGSAKFKRSRRAQERRSGSTKHNMSDPH